VDDIITGNDPQAVTYLIHDLDWEFSLKDLGPLHYFLGLECYCIPSGLFLSQQKYILDLLLRFKMDSVKSVSLPMATSCNLSKVGGTPLSDPFVYQSMVGLYNTLALSDPILPFRWTRSPSSCKLQPMSIRLLSNGSFISNLPFNMAFFSLVTLLFLFRLQTGRVIDDRKSTSGYCIFLVEISFIGARRTLWYDLVLRPSIEACLMLQ